MDEKYLKRIDLITPLNTLGPQAREQLLEHSEIREIAVGKVLFEEGDIDEWGFYLLDGTVEARSETRGTSRVIDLSRESANYALGNLQPRPFTLKSQAGTSHILAIPRSMVEEAVARSQTLTSEMPSVTVSDMAGGSEIDGAWMFQVIQSSLFKDLPTENIEQFFAKVERVEVPDGALLIRQGDAGDYFYMVAEGSLLISREINGIEFPIAELVAGDSCGEEALISARPRNAKVIAGPDGAVVMRLKGTDFQALLKSPTIRSASTTEVTAALRDGSATFVDVRMPSEHGAQALKGALNVPLFKLREQTSLIPTDKPVITYCDSGVRSKIAAFLLCQRDYDARFLEGGLSALLGEVGG